MTRVCGYGLLCATFGAALVLLGIVLFGQFFLYHAPASKAFGPVPLGPNGAYIAGFAGTCLVAWGGALIGAARRPSVGRSVGTATAVSLVLAAVQRLAAWVVGDYAGLGDLPRIEAAVFLLLALAFVWLRPARSLISTEVLK